MCPQTNFKSLKHTQASKSVFRFGNIKVCGNETQVPYTERNSLLPDRSRWLSGERCRGQGPWTWRSSVSTPHRPPRCLSLRMTRHWDPSARATDVNAAATLQKIEREDIFLLPHPPPWSLVWQAAVLSILSTQSPSRICLQFVFYFVF